MDEHPQKLSDALRAALRCPVCGAQLEPRPEGLACRSGNCQTKFPVADGVPILINEANSLFSFDDFAEKRATYFKHESKLGRLAKRLTPSLNRNVRSAANFAKLLELVRQYSKSPRVLVIGGGILGAGMDDFARASDLELVETDVSLAPRTQVVCDCHDLPFPDGWFDAVVAQAVLEHVVDPYRCVDEIHRVLNASGYVYVETPFMQQVHGGKYDFTRFTYLGHRRLLRRFEEVDAGVVGGPAIALAWAYRYFLLSLAPGTKTRNFMQVFARLTAFWLKYFDPLLLGRPGSLDAASAYYLLGRKSDRVLHDRDLIKLYRGL